MTYFPKFAAIAAATTLFVSGCNMPASGPQFATVEKVTPIETTVTTPHEVCEDRAVTRREAERDGNVGGTVAGAIVGGLIGNQVGGGKGKDLATAAGAVAGGAVGHKIDKDHEGGRQVTEIQRDCRTEQTSETKIDGYTVDYTYNGQRHSVTMAAAPAEQKLEVNADGTLIQK